MKAYKGFFKNEDGTLQCRNFVYKEGRTYWTWKAEMCHCGFHACTLPIDVFAYYNSNGGNVEFHEVELKFVSKMFYGDSKVCGKLIKIGRKITPDEMVDISIKMIMKEKDEYFGTIELYKIQKDDKFNFINTEGKILSDTWYDYCSYSGCHNLGIVKICGLYNFVDIDGKYISKDWFHEVGNFVEGHARVRYNDKWNLIKGNGTLLNKQWFECCYNMHSGNALVTVDGQSYVVDQYGDLHNCYV